MTAEPNSSTPIDLTAGNAVRLSRRWNAVAALVQLGLIVGVAAGVAYGWRYSSGAFIATGLMLAWLVMAIASVRSRRLAVESASFIANGDYAQAERLLEDSLRGFSILGSSKVFGLHQLATVRHARGQWQDVAELCEEVLRRGNAGMTDVHKPTRLMLTDALLELGQDGPAGLQLAALSRARLNLQETISLLSLQLDHGLRAGDFESIARDLAQKTSLSELMPARAAGKAQAILALAAKRTMQVDFAATLTRRASLLCDVEELIRHRPALAELWPDRAVAAVAEGPATN
jgi:hypothetical protein